jgi:hypothetical protein
MRAPRLKEGVSLTSMQFTPFEGFILSRLDGVASLEDIADSTGATLVQVEAVIARLEALEALAWVEHGRPTSRESKPPPLRSSGERPGSSSSPSPSSSVSVPRAPRIPTAPETTKAPSTTKTPSTASTSTPKPSAPMPSVSGDGASKPPRSEPERISRPSATPSRGIVRTKPAPPDAPRQLYDPTELEEPGVDLDSDRRREILDTFYRLDHLDHYQLFGLERDADKKDIREAYFRLSKLFHPDTLYGKRLGSYKVKMEAVFRRLTDAYEVLGKAKKRERYDDYLRAKDLSEQVRRGLAEGETRAARLEREATEAIVEAVVDPGATSDEIPRPNTPPGPASRPASVPPSSPSSPSSASSPGAPRPSTASAPRPASAPPTVSEPFTPPTKEPRPPSVPPGPARPTSTATPRAPLDDEAKRQLARDLLQRRLKGATGRPATPPAPSPAPPSPPPEAADKDALLRGLASSLRQAARVTAGGDRAERQLQDARVAEQRGDLVAAVNSLRLATSLAPEREDIAHELDRVRHLLAKQLAETYERQARYEEENGEHAAAARSWMKVAEGRPERYVYPMYAAQAFLKANAELKLAKDLAERAAQLAPDVARARAVLAEVFLRAGMKANAKRELDAAAKLDPEADFVKHLRRELK